jgi:hypothetical protein
MTKAGNPAACLAVSFAKAVKNSVVSKFFGNFVPNFREQMADDKHCPDTKNQKENIYEKTTK